MVTAEEIIAVASREIGYHENADKKNKYGEWYGATFSPPQSMWNGVPWCMEFVQWVYHMAGMDLPHKTASCGELLNWYKRNQPECVTTNPIPGCIVIFDFPGTAYSTDHTGLFVRSNSMKITTIDGNTGNGSDSNGGWVQQKSRTWSYANPKFIRPRGLILVDWDRAISEMTDEQAYKLYAKAERHMATLPLPTSWNANEELDKAVKAGITDGSRPMVPAKRYEAAIMCERAVRK